MPIYEKRYPKDKRPQEAIEAARSYIAGHISLDELLIKRRAAAYAAADADYAAAAADVKKQLQDYLNTFILITELF